MKHYLFSLLLFVCSLSIFGQNVQKWQHTKDKQKSAIELVQSQKTEWGLSEKDALIQKNETAKTDNLGFKHYRYQQTYNNVPIEGAEWLVHEKNGIAEKTNGMLISGLTLSTVPTLSEEQALQYALNSVNAEVWAWEDDFLEGILQEDNSNATYYPTGTLSIISPDLMKGNANVESYRLAYKFDVFAVSPFTRHDIYVDAHNGEIVTSIGSICHADVPASGTASYSCNNPVDITIDERSNGDYRLYEEFRGEGNGIHTRSSDNGNSPTTIEIVSADAFFDEDPDAVAVHYALEKTYDYLYEKHGRNSIDDNGYKLKAWVHYGNNFNNAIWAGSFALFGDGDGVKYSALTSIDIVAHETAHGLIARTAGSTNSGESGALNESFSDIFGTLVEFYAEPDCADWLIGEDAVIEAGKTATRNMANPKDETALTQQPNTYRGEYWLENNQWGHIHRNNGVLNYWFYLIANGGSGTNDNDLNYNLLPLDNDFNASLDKAGAIAYRMLTTYLTTFSQYADARAAAIAATEDLYGTDSNEMITVINAFCAVGLGECVPNPNSITLTLPNGGEVWQNGTTETISWTSSNDIASVNISLSLNGGASWQILETATENDGSHEIVVPNFATTQAMIRIENSEDATVQDISNAVFRIDACNVASAFESSAVEVCQNESISFTNTSFNATDSEWRVNANLVSTNANLNYTFTEAGTFLVSLRSINGNCIDDYFEVITVYPAADANFTYTKTDLEVQLFATDEQATTYTWTVDNVNIGNTANLNHTFTEEGTYNVCLSSSNNCGTDNYCKNIVASLPNICEGSGETWRRYLNGDYIRALLEVGDNIFVGTYGSGLVKINQVTGKTTIFNTTNSDLLSNNIYSLLESASGDIFIGTGNGLAKFDGTSATGWTIFNTDNSDLPNSSIKALLESSSGEIFVRIDNGLAKFDGTSAIGWTIFNTENSDLPSDYILFPNHYMPFLLESSNGDIFVGTSNGLAKFDGTSATGWTIFNTDNSDLPNNMISTLLESSNGDIFVGTSNGLAKFDGTSATGWTIFNTDNSDLLSNNIYSLLESASGDIFIGTGNGLAKFDETSATGWAIFNTDNSDLPSNYISFLLESNTGYIFVETLEGLLKFDGISNISWTNIFNTYSASNYIDVLLEGSSGNIFAGTDNGLAKFDGSNSMGWAIFNTDNSDLPNNYINALLESSSGDIFVGTSNGLAKFDGTSATGWTIFNTENSDLPSNMISTLLESNDGEIFVATLNGGLAKFDGNNTTGWTIFNTENSDLPHYHTICLLETSEGEIFIGTLNSGLAKFDGNNATGWTIFNTENSDLPSNSIRSLLESSNGEIFVGTGEGLAKFDGVSSTGWTIFNTENSDLPSNSIRSLLESSSGEIFVGNTELAKFDGISNTDWTIVNTEYFDLLTNTMNTLLETSNGEIFIGTNGGLSVLNLGLTASFNISTTPICTNETITFTNTALNAETYKWQINGVLSSTATDFTHTFTEAGEYTITLKAFDAQDCEDTHSQTITVYNNATDLDLGEDVAFCQNNTVLINNVIIEAGLNDMDTYSWHLNGTEIGTTATITATQSGTYTLSVTDMCGNTNSDTINVIIEDDCVWPGDTNYDYFVNNKDLLPIGLAFGTSGFSRPNASLNWEGQACQDWGNVQIENGIDYKHIDTNGDGMIDSNDALAITANYGKTHNPIYAPPNENNSLISLETELTSANTFNTGSTNFIVVDLILKENEDNQDIATYGLAFDLEYNIPPELATINSVNVLFEDSWLGSADELLTIWKHIPEQNKIEMGMTRINQQNALGKGKVGEVIVEIDIEVITFDEIALDFATSNIDMVLSNNTFVPVNTNTATFNFTNDACNTPTNLQETDLTCNDVTLNWDAMPNADIYRLRGRKASKPFKVFPDMTNNFRTFTGGLKPNAVYEWQIRARCGDTWTDYAPLQSFTTPTCKNSTYDASKDPFFVNENESLFSQINLYPNPAKNNLNISFKSFEEENINVKVIDILGKIVLAEKIETSEGENNFDLNIETLQTGTYFLQIDENVQKFMVY